jgi:hypothetical protein
VRERSKAVLVAVGGAVVGGAVAYLCLTEHGRAIRRDVDVVLDDVLREFDACRLTAEKTASVADRGWSLVSSMFR